GHVWVPIPGGRPPRQHPRNAVPPREEACLRRRGLSAVGRVSPGVIPRVIPGLLIEDGGHVKTVKFRDPRYVGDPINAVRIFNDKKVDERVVVDIRASKDGRSPDESAIGEIVSEAFMPVGYGGGVRDLETATRLV